MVLRTPGPTLMLPFVALAAVACLAAGCDPGEPSSSATGTRTSAPTPAQASTPSAADEVPAPVETAPIGYAFEPPQLDFGILRPKQAIDGSFRIRNTGVGTLRIGAIKATCACTTLGRLDRRVLEPGDEVEVSVNLEGRASGGTRRTAIDVVFEGPDKRAERTQYMLLAEYARAVRTIPGYLNLTQGLAGTLRLAGLDDRPFRVLAVRGATPDFVDYDPATDEPRTKYELRYDYSEYDPETCANAQGEPMPRYLAIETDHPDAPLLDMALRHVCTVPRPADLRGRTWYVTEQSLNLGAVLPGEPIDLDLEIKWLPRSKDRSAMIHTVLSETPEMQAKLLEVIPTDEGYACRVQVRPVAGFTGLLYGQLRIHSEQHDQLVVVLASVRDDVVTQTASGG